MSTYGYDIHITYMDGKEETVLKIHEHSVTEGILNCWVHEPKSHKHIGAYPTSNIRKFVIQW